MGILVVLDSVSFNLYYSKSVPILKTYYDYTMEAERIRIEEEGHPDDIYLKKPSKIWFKTSI